MGVTGGVGGSLGVGESRDGVGGHWHMGWGSLGVGWETHSGWVGGGHCRGQRGCGVGDY